jgi:hypothetical protein
MTMLCTPTVHTARSQVFTAALPLPLAALSQTVVYSTGFEAPTFTVGPIGDAYLLPNSGQDGWRASPRAPYATAPSPWALVSTQRPASGTQSLQLSMQSDFYNGVNGYGVSVSKDFSATPIALNPLTDAFSVSMRLYLDQSPTSERGWGLSLTTANCCGLGVTLLPATQQVVYGHNLMNQSVSYSPGFSLVNTWLTRRIERDATDYSALRLSIGNGSTTWQQLLSSPGGAMPYVAFGGIIPTFPVAAFGTAYIDDLTIGYNLAAVPEPASWALMLVGVSALLARRRRS